MKKILSIILIVLSCYSCNNNKETCTTVGTIDKMMWGYKRWGNTLKITYISFTHDDQLYTFKKEYGGSVQINVGDSVQIQYYCNNPKKVISVGVFQ